MVWAHGGPTSRAPLVLDLEIAYFTSRGIGVAEVNYGGSTGYGRAYRNRLREQWGVVDVEDCAAVARQLAGGGHRRPGAARRPRRQRRRLDDRGLPDLAGTTGLYACGTIIYPILDLTGWATGETHDFESQYLESLVGPFERRSRPLPRPLTRSTTPTGSTAPFLLLQGLDDVICPPVQCDRFLETGRPGAACPHAYLTFEGEGHGFRRAETIVRARGGRTVPVRPDVRHRTAPTCRTLELKP